MVQNSKIAKYHEVHLLKTFIFARPYTQAQEFGLSLLEKELAINSLCEPFNGPRSDSCARIEQCCIG